MTERTQQHGLTIKTKIMCALRVYPYGCYQYPGGYDPLISLSSASVSRAIHEVADAIVVNFSDEYIRFPNDAERVAIKQQ